MSKRGDLIFLVGFMGCGKSATGRRLAERLGWQFVDADIYIEHYRGQTIPEIFASLGELAFRQIETEALANLCSLHHTIVATGGGLPCFGNNMQILNESGTTIYLHATPELLAERLLHARVERPLVKGKSPEELLRYIKQTLEQRDVFYTQADLIVETHSDNSFLHIEQIIKAINN